jgi:hypothetical protein
MRRPASERNPCSMRRPASERNPCSMRRPASERNALARSEAKPSVVRVARLRRAGPR